MEKKKAPQAKKNVPQDNLPTIVTRSNAGRPAGLTEKEILFCEEYMKTYNASESYRRAFGSTNKNINTVAVAAFKLREQPKVKQYLERLKAEVAEVIQISRYKILEEYAKIAFSSMAEFHENWIEVKDFNKLTEAQKSVIAEIKMTTKRERIENDEGDMEWVERPIVTFKLHDKIRALDSISRMLGYDAPTKLEVGGMLQSAPIINVYNTAPPLASSEDEIK